MPRSVTVTVAHTFSVPLDEAWSRIVESDVTEVSQPWGPIPGVTRVVEQPDGFFEEPGLSRVLETSDGATLTEHIDHIERPGLLEYSLSDLTSPFRLLTPGASASFRLEPIADAETRVTWRYTWHARNILTLPLVSAVVRGAYRPYMRRMLARIAAWTPADPR